MAETYKSIMKRVLTEEQYDNFCRAFNEAHLNNTHGDLLAEAQLPSEILLASFPWTVTSYPEGCADVHFYWHTVWDMLCHNELKQNNEHH